MRISIKYKIALCLLIAMALYGFAELYIVHTQTDYYWRADTTAFFTAAKMHATGEGERLYDLEQQKRVQLDLLSGKSFADGLLPYNYPPHFALLLSLASDLNLKQFYFIFLSIQFILVILILILIAGIAELDGKEKLFAACLFLAQDALSVTLFLGALSITSCLGLLLFYYALKHNRNMALFTSVLLLTIKPQFLAILFPLVFLFSAANLFAAALVAFSVMVICCLSYPNYIWLDFLTLLNKCSMAWDSLGIYPEKMINLKSVLANLYGDIYKSQINQFTKIVFILSVVVVGYVVCRIRLIAAYANTAPKELLISLSILSYMAFAVHVNPQDALVLYVPALLVYVYSKENLIYKKMLISLVIFYTIGMHLVRAVCPNYLPVFTFIVSCFLLIMVSLMFAKKFARN